MLCEVVNKYMPFSQANGAEDGSDALVIQAYDYLI
jgi:hypothetical protein